MAATQRDIADSLGMAVSTVSRALRDDASIPESTKQRVRKAAQQLGYRRDVYAASLRTGRTGNIALVVPAIDNPFFAELAHHVEDEANRAGMRLTIANGQEDCEVQERAVRSLLERRVDAMILVPAGCPSARLLELVAEIPTIALDRRLSGADVDTVIVDGAESVHALAAHSQTQGYRRPAVITGLDVTSTGSERASLVDEAFADTGINDVPIMTCRHDANEAAAITTRLLDQHSPDLVICGSNVIALGVLRTLQSQGIPLGSGIGVATFDDLPWFELMSPGLTAIEIDARALAVDALRLLSERLANPSSTTQLVSHPTRLNLRGSTMRN